MERVSISREVRFVRPIEEFIEGREIYVGVIGNDKPAALRWWSWISRKLPEGMPGSRGKEVSGTRAVEAYESAHSAARATSMRRHPASSRIRRVQVYCRAQAARLRRVDMR